MAKGTITFTKGTGDASWKWLQGKIEWSSSSLGSTENKSTVTTKLYARTGTGGTYASKWSGKVKVGSNTQHSFSTLDKTTTIGDDYVLLKTYTDTVDHNDDGTCSVKISGSVTGPASTSLEGVTSSGNKTVDLDTIPRHAKAEISLLRKNETSITIDWSTDVDIDHIWYTVDDGDNWIDKGEAGGTSGSFTIGGLEPNTLYQVRLAVRRTDSQLRSTTLRLEVATYDYPKCKSTPSFTIENELTLGIENPLGRTCTVSLIGADGTVYGEYETNGTSVTGFNESEAVEWLYSTIPNDKQGNYRVRVTHQGNVRETEGTTYSINTSLCLPTFSNYTYRDKSSVANVTGNDQVLVKGKSSLEVTISSANKMVPKNGASPVKYNVLIDTLNTNVDYSTSDLVVDVGTVINGGTKRLSVTAFDSRTLSHSVNKDILVYDYVKPTVNLDVSRLNNFEAQTTLKINGTYDRVTLDGVDKNTITAVQYRYKETGTNAEWSNWTNVKATLSNGQFTCVDTIISLDNGKAFEFEVQAVDKLDLGTTEGSIDVGEAIFFISSNKKACYINDQKIIMYDIVEEW